MYLKLQLNEVPSVVQIACVVWSCHMKFDHEQAISPQHPNALILKALQMTGSLNTLHTLYASAQPEQNVKKLSKKNELQAGFLLFTSQKKHIVVFCFFLDFCNFIF